MTPDATPAIEAGKRAGALSRARAWVADTPPARLFTKSFLERNPVIIGMITVALIAAGVLGALVLNAGLFKDRYTVNAQFADAAGIRPGDAVRVAGVEAGQVDSVSEVDGEVEVSMLVDSGVELPHDSRAEVRVETVLGTKNVTLVAGSDWDEMLEDDDTIPVERTETPVELFDLQDIGTRLFDESDGAEFDQLLESLTQITEGQEAPVQDIITGLNRITGAINEREDEARQLLSSAATLTETIANRDDDLVEAIDNLNVVISGLEDRREDLQDLLVETAQTSGLIADVVGGNRAELDAILDDIHRTLEVVGRHQEELAAGVSYIGATVEGFSSIAYPQGQLVEWGNVFTQLIGPTGPDGIFGACMPVDRALDAALGPDPIGPNPNNPDDCAAREGTFPGMASTSESSSEPADPQEQIAQGLATLITPFLTGPSPDQAAMLEDLPIPEPGQ